LTPGFDSSNRRRSDFEKTGEKNFLTGYLKVKPVYALKGGNAAGK
jgi:hypothetical protein